MSEIFLVGSAMLIFLRFLYCALAFLFSSPCLRQRELLLSLGVHRSSSVVRGLSSVIRRLSSTVHRLSSVIGRPSSVVRRPLTFHILILSSATHLSNTLKHGRKYLWRVLYKDCSYCPDPLTNMVATGNFCF
jgi:hypothetical protein